MRKDIYYPVWVTPVTACSVPDQAVLKIRPAFNGRPENNRFVVLQDWLKRPDLKGLCAQYRGDFWYHKTLYLDGKSGLSALLKQSGNSVYASNAERRRRGEELILRVAEEVFAELGFQGATMTEIGKRADLPKANIHYYFSSKANLYQRVIDDVFTVWMEAANKFDDHDDPRTALSAYISAKMELARSRPNGSKVWANEIINGAPMIRDYLETHLLDWCVSREARIQSWIDDGMLRPVNPRYLLYMIWASTQHYADFSTQINLLNGGKPLSESDFEAATETLSDVILNGLLNDAPQSVS